MKRIALLFLPVLTITGAAVGNAPEASAEALWNGNSPVFRSEIRARQARLERQRQERRKRYSQTKFPAFMKGGAKPKIEPEAPQIVTLSKKERAGTIIIDTEGKRLFYVLKDNRAYLYPISVGRQGFTWTGRKRISRVANWPTWTPPPEMRRRQPGLPRVMTGGVRNPLGAKSLYLGSSLYRIHGTNNPRTIGRAASSGCFRMMNEHVTHLATLARIGTLVKVVARYDGAPGLVADIPGRNGTRNARFSAETFFN